MKYDGMKNEITKTSQVNKHQLAVVSLSLIEAQRPPCHNSFSLQPDPSLPRLGTTLQHGRVSVIVRLCRPCVQSRAGPRSRGGSLCWGFLGWSLLGRGWSSFLGRGLLWCSCSLLRWSLLWCGLLCWCLLRCGLLRRCLLWCSLLCWCLLWRSFLRGGLLWCSFFRWGFLGWCLLGCCCGYGSFLGGGLLRCCSFLCGGGFLDAGGAGSFGFGWCLLLGLLV